MPAQVHDFQRPAPETDYDELKPFVFIAEGDKIIIKDPNDESIIEPRAVYCCQCVEGGISMCIPEQTFGSAMTSLGAQTIAYYFA